MKLNITEFFYIYAFQVIFFTVLFSTSNAFPNSKKGTIDPLLGEFKELVDKTKKAEPEYYENNSEENQKIWDVYYDCLDKQLELSMILKALPPDTLTVLEGGTARMECMICFSPSLLIDLPPNWTWTGDPLPEDDSVVIDRWSGLLSLFGARPEQAGLYECRLGSAISRPVLLHVVPASAGLRLVRGPGARQGAATMGDSHLLLHSTRLVLYSDWTPWSECSKCGQVGRHYRFGACTLRLPKEEEKSTIAPFMKQKLSLMRRWGKGRRTKRDLKQKSLSEAREAALKFKKKIWQLIHKPGVWTTIKPTKTSATTTVTWPKTNKTLPANGSSASAPIETTKSPEALPPDFLHILELFVDGLPCVSELLPWSLRTHSNVTARKNEIMEGFCKTLCADEIFEVKDKFGNILERVNNSDGVFSALQGPPAVPPLPSRSSVFAAVGRPLVLTCPGHLHHDVPYHWTVNRTIRIYPRAIANQSAGRVTMDYRQRLVFKEVEPGDSKLYVCWQVDSIAGVVRLVVYDPSTVAFDHHIMLVGVTLVLGTFVYLFSRIYMNRLRASAA